MKMLCFIILICHIFNFADSNRYTGTGILIDSVIDDLAEESSRREAVMSHFDIVVGHGHSDNNTEPKPKIPVTPLLEPSDRKVHHKKRPPTLNSLCDIEEYEKVFNAFFGTPFLKRNERVLEHKKIELALHQGVEGESDEYPWSLCQYGGIQMECGEKRRCRCLYRNVPHRYVKGKPRENNSTLTCLGIAGSICTNDPRSRIYCLEGLECKKGYCGGLKIAARQVIIEASSFGILMYPSNLIIVFKILIFLLENL